MSFGKGGGGGGKECDEHLFFLLLRPLPGEEKFFGPGRRRKEKQVLSSLYIPLMIFLGETFASFFSGREITFFRSSRLWQIRGGLCFFLPTHLPLPD